MSYAWTAYSTSFASAPIQAGGMINTLGSNVTSGLGSISLSVMDPTTGAHTDYTTTLFDGPQSLTNLATDGANIYVAYRDIYPRDWFSSWAIGGGYPFTANLIGSVYDNHGLVVDTVTGTAVVTGGTNSHVTPAAANYFLPATALTYATFAGTGELGYAIRAGANVYSVLVGTTDLLELDPTTLALVATHTLPAAGSGFQIGWDGTYLYIAAAATGTIVWDVGAGTGVLVGATALENHFYSTNLGLVVTHDGSGNIYSMPAGGGSLTTIGNADTITGTIGQNLSGFCDGFSSDLWANCTNGGGSPAFFNIVYAPASGNPMRLLL